MVLREENFSRARLSAIAQQERRRSSRDERKEKRRAVCECDFVHICAGVCP